MNFITAVVDVPTGHVFYPNPFRSVKTLTRARGQWHTEQKLYPAYHSPS